MAKSHSKSADLSRPGREASEQLILTRVYRVAATVMGITLLAAVTGAFILIGAHATELSSDPAIIWVLHLIPSLLWLVPVCALATVGGVWISRDTQRLSGLIPWALAVLIVILRILQ